MAANLGAIVDIGGDGLERPKVLARGHDVAVVERDLGLVPVAPGPTVKPLSVASGSGR